MAEQESIESIKRIGGHHLQTFTPDNFTDAMGLAAVSDNDSAFYMVTKEFRTEERNVVTCKTEGRYLSMRNAWAWHN